MVRNVNCKPGAHSAPEAFWATMSVGHGENNSGSSTLRRQPCNRILIFPARPDMEEPRTDRPITCQELSCGRRRDSGSHANT